MGDMRLLGKELAKPSDGSDEGTMKGEEHLAKTGSSNIAAETNSHGEDPGDISLAEIVKHNHTTGKAMLTEENSHESVEVRALLWNPHWECFNPLWKEETDGVEEGKIAYTLS